ncbi:uncharacterized protein RCO7_05454 [Rhynchosporium graminicola]|uniref:Uncharacterized protein n=1 Tax=Rhynchosporium graminicola TaxID=2792576 RepID=A0A1E1KV23_9HELO|nr:uncharacterized protein RCO7_05454 [Rhynchosporium commune]
MQYQNSDDFWFTDDFWLTDDLWLINNGDILAPITSYQPQLNADAAQPDFWLTDDFWPPDDFWLLNADAAPKPDFWLTDDFWPPDNFWLINNSDISAPKTSYQPQSQQPQLNADAASQPVTNNALSVYSSLPARILAAGHLPFPPRLRYDDDSELEYGFDLPTDIRTAGNRQFEIPLAHNRDYDYQFYGNSPPYRFTPWSTEMEEFLWYLVQLAMLQKNRYIRYTEFRPITEALNRKFKDQQPAGTEYFKIGWRNVQGKFDYMSSIQLWKWTL